MCKFLAFSCVSTFALAVALFMFNLTGIRFYMAAPPLIALFTTMTILTIDSQRYITICIYAYILMLIISCIAWIAYGSIHDLLFFDQQHSLALIVPMLSASTMILTLLFSRRVCAVMSSCFHYAFMIIVVVIFLFYICISIAGDSSGMSKQQTIISLSYFVSTAALHGVVLFKIHCPRLYSHRTCYQINPVTNPAPECLDSRIVAQTEEGVYDAAGQGDEE